MSPLPSSSSACSAAAISLASSKGMPSSSAKFDSSPASIFPLPSARRIAQRRRFSSNSGNHDDAANGVHRSIATKWLKSL
jgi:hypothetical protein